MNERSGTVQEGYAPPSRQAPERGWPRWLVALSLVWAVLLVGLTALSVRRDPPTVREQRTLAQAAWVADRAVGRLALAAGDAPLALVPAQVEPGCRISPFAPGAELVRAVTVLTPAGGERALLERVSEALPADWRAGVRVGTEGPRLRADAGDFVLVEGRVVAEGRVQLRAVTGCRPVRDGWQPPDGDPTGPETPALSAAAALVDSPFARGRSVQIAFCPDGGVVRTTRVAGPPLADPRPGLTRLAAGNAAVDTLEVYAYRAGAVSVVAEFGADELEISATSVCSG
ncbi:hypothetical protein GA0070616_2032 [Micromonospora nigra]|uniref:Uncharacterized protein n=1 Tax=Micromonospora nigra TaxID=145857 RepID=A0A1C6RTT3_9ACTN|nr:hypothetical protein [Micromonospora nigra]SCL20616.1 hypothetical protein GA0070616_2032 [Micromonospora nigra]